MVAACRMLEGELPAGQQFFADPFARLVVDDAAIEAARADPHLQNVIRLRTRYIDDAIGRFVSDHGSVRRAQVLLLGAGLDARAYRMHVDADFFEVDFPATLELKADLLRGSRPLAPRVAVPVDLAARSFIEPLIEAGFDRANPTIVVWEGVSMYLDPDAADGVVAQMSAAVPAGSQVVADYAEMSWFKGSEFEQATATIANELRRGGEPLKAGLRDVRGTFDRYEFDVVDDVPTEELRTRYGLEPLPRHYPTRMITARRRA